MLTPPSAGIPGRRREHVQRSKAKVPEEPNIENWRDFAPQVKGAAIWFEAATARVRASYSAPSSRLA
eukprot:8438030-Lingulodinium_polyedra.AAC.1